MAAPELSGSVRKNKDGKCSREMGNIGKEFLLSIYAGIYGKICYYRQYICMVPAMARQGSHKLHNYFKCNFLLQPWCQPLCAQFCMDIPTIKYLK